MLPATIILANNENEALDQARQRIDQLFNTPINPDNNPDFLLIDQPQTITIAAIRKLKRDLSLKPYQEKYKIALIKNAQNLSHEAQNALLKTLEEPPANSLIFLTAVTKNNFLPTILSRCQVVEIQSNNQEPGGQEQALATAQKIIAASPAERIKIAASIGKITEAKIFCLDQLYFFRQQIKQKENQNLVTTIKQLLETLDWLKVNVNPQLALGNLLLSYPKSLKINSKT